MTSNQLFALVATLGLGALAALLLFRDPDDPDYLKMTPGRIANLIVAERHQQERAGTV